MSNIDVSMLIPINSRSAGGVASSLLELSSALISKSIPVTVYTGKDKHTNEDSKLWAGIDLKLHDVLGPKSFNYMCNLNKSLMHARPRIIHQHGLWMYHTIAATLISKLGSTLLISPHGALNEWAMKKSKIRKRIALLLYQRTNFNAATCLHALNDFEAECIRSAGFNNPIAIIPNGTNAKITQINQCVSGKINARKNLLFLGRITHQKGLVNLITAYFHIKNELMAADNWQITIAGWDQGGHLVELQNLVERFGISNNIIFSGPAFGSLKENLFSTADAFILPSITEGLPMTILEAWAHGLPVLMTDRCNLPDGVKFNAAFESKSDILGIKGLLQKLFVTSNEDLLQMGRNGRELVERIYNWNTVSDNYIKLYEWLIFNTSKPDFLHL